MLEKTSEHPVFITLGNILNWHQNKPDAKVLLAYLPKMKETDKHKKQKEFYTAKHHLFQYSFEVLIEPIKSGSFNLRTDNGIIHSYLNYLEICQSITL